MSNDVTNKYLNMIHAFECDFSIAKNYNEYGRIDTLKNLLINKDVRLLKDIELLEELSFNLRHKKIILMEVDEL